MPRAEQQRWYVALHPQSATEVTPSAVAGPFEDQVQAAGLAEWIVVQYASCRALAIAADPSNEGVLFGDAPRFPGSTVGLQQAVATCAL